MCQDIRDFKVGESVRIVDQSAGWDGVQRGDLGVICKIDLDRDIIWLKHPACNYDWRCTPKCLRKLNVADTPNAAPKSDEYQFKSAPGMIDIARIHNDLSYGTPIAVVHTAKDAGFIVVHNSIFTKAKLCKVRKPDILKANKALEFTLTNIGDIGYVKGWVQKVKEVKYPETQRPVDVTVKLIVI